MIDPIGDLADYLNDNLITEDHPMRIVQKKMASEFKVLPVKMLKTTEWSGWSKR